MATEPPTPKQPYRSRLWRMLIVSIAGEQLILLALRHIPPVQTMAAGTLRIIFTGALVAIAGATGWIGWQSIAQHRRTLRSNPGT